MPYKFSGKELDEETGLYYYGARYYEPDVAVWFGVDMLTEKYPNVGGYVYCVGSPIMRIDPDGKDDFLVRPNGKIKQVQKEGESVVVLVDKKGNSTGVTYSIGENAQLVNGQGKTQVLIINDQEKAHDAFKGIAKHTWVEFGKIEYNETASNTDKTLLFTNGERGEISASTLAKGIENNEIGTVTTIDHSHTSGYPTPSGYDRVSGNINSHNLEGDAKNAVEYPTNAKGQAINRHVYNPDSKTTYKYDATKFHQVQDY
jgi:RHS repeat-associated protein